jgi:preprotein translocase subunit SecE
VWPTRKETVTTGIMVVIMTAILGIFFFVTDSAFAAIVKALLGLITPGS